jgi:hypothetical protein
MIILFNIKKLKVFICTSYLIGLTFIQGLNAKTPPKTILNLIDNHCIDCHDDDVSKGDLDFYALKWDLNQPKSTESWTRVLDVLESGDMPPKKKSKLSEQDRASAIDNLTHELKTHQSLLNQKQGRSLSRRINRYEYENILRDVLHDPTLKIAHELPLDGEVQHFSKVGSALDISHVQMEAYIDIVTKALERAINFPEKRPKVTTQKRYARGDRGLWSGSGNRRWDRWSLALDGFEVNRKHSFSTAHFKEKGLTWSEDDSIAIFRGFYTPFYYGFKDLKTSQRGHYKIKLKARSVLRQTDYVDWEGDKKPADYPALVLDATRRFKTPVNDRIYPGKRSEPIKIFSSTLHEPNQVSVLPIGVIEVSPEAKVYNLKAYMEKGAMVKFDGIRLPTPMVPALPHRTKKIDPDGYPGIAFHWLEVEGPFYEQWPPKSYQALFGDLPYAKKDGTIQAISKQPTVDVKALVKQFMERFYRRDIQEKESNRFIKYAQNLMEEGASFTSAMLSTYTAILVSPEFLFLSSETGPLKQTAIAERLAFFLNNSGPDQALKDLAKKGKLLDKPHLKKELDRLIYKPEFDRFVKDFLDSWLSLSEINDTEPDRKLYPEYAGDGWLIQSMLNESRYFFKDLIQNNRPAHYIIDSNYTFADERLAQHYNIDSVQGIEFRKIPLSENSPYGGMLTQASVLKVTANGTTTSPVLRGVYVIERLLGEHLPPPPPVDAAEPDIRGATTIRDILKKHREDPSCASCHQKIDPPGFALENFDVMGKWRTNYRALSQGTKKVEGIGRSGNEFIHYIAQKIDASGTTPKGKPFEDINGLKKHLLEDKKKIAKNILEQLIVYATGAKVSIADREIVEDILNKSEASEYGLKTLILEMIQSPLFTNK